MKIAIITSNQKGINSPHSGVIQTCRNIQKITQNAGHLVTVNVCNSRRALQRIVDQNPDLVLLMNQSVLVKGQQDINLTDYFISEGINVSGTLSGVSNFEADQALSRLKLKKCGINSARFFMATAGKIKSIFKFPDPIPLEVRRIDTSLYHDIEGSKSIDDFEDNALEILNLTSGDKRPAMAEECLHGQTFACAVIHSNSQGFLVSVIETRQQDKGSILDSHDSLGHVGIRFNRISNNRILGRIESHAIQIFNHLGFRDYAMINIMMNSLGDFYFIQSDKSAGIFERNSAFSKACKLANNLTYDAMVRLMLEGGIFRAPTTMTFARDYALNTGEKFSWLEKLRHRCFGSV